MLNNLKFNSATIKKGIIGYTLLDCIQETTELMSVIDDVAFFEFVKAFDPELNKDLQFFPTEPYI